MSPNLFHNPLTSGMNSIKHSPGTTTHSMSGSTYQFNHTATFAGNSIVNNEQPQPRVALKDITEIESSGAEV
jgi:hypothetical protein